MKTENIKSQWSDHSITYHSITYDDSQEAKEKLFIMMLEFFKKHNAYSGESIHQCDAPQIAAPTVLSDVAEKIFKFDVKYKEE
jgi:hypothetical protein